MYYLLLLLQFANDCKNTVITLMSFQSFVLMWQYFRIYIRQVMDWFFAFFT
jgi:hypothetical protein